MNKIRDKKYAVMLSGMRITDYMYDDVIQTRNTLYGIQHVQKGVSTIHAYSKHDGKLLFKKTVNNYNFFEDCLILEVTNELNYIYFDSIQKIKGPFYEVKIEKYLIKVRSLVNNNPLYGAYDVKGNLVLPLTYDYIWAISDKFLEVCKKKEIGLVDYDGDYILEPKCAEVNYYFNDSLITFYDENVEAFGAIDEYGKMFLPCEYDSIEVDEKSGLIYIQKDRLYGICEHNIGFIFFPTFRCLEKNREVVELIGLDTKTYGYIPKLGLLLPRRDYVYYENYLKYFDGYKWRKLKYDKE